MDLKEVFPKPKALALALLLIAGAVVALEQPWRSQSAVPPPPANIPPELLRFPAAPDFGGATGWIQSEPQELVQLRGRVVLVDFWTYSCINCIHTFPYLRAWHERYNGSGLVIVGVHTPEFRFEHDARNVRDAAERYGLEYAIAQDNDYSVWEAYRNRYWPAEYLIDAYGRIRYTHFGEGSYDRTEQAIRDLLREAGHDVPPGPLVDPGRMTVDHSPELYAAAAQGEDRVAIGNPEGYRPGQRTTYARPAPDDVAQDRIYLVGTWDATRENVTARDPNASVIVRFRGGGANFVGDGPRDACVHVLLDGAPLPEAFAPPDVRTGQGEACVPLDGPRSYDFFEGPNQAHYAELGVPEGFVLFTFVFSSEGRGEP